ncbi:hypothetical protein [Hylemonella gracilis]|uniref:hypothetical protein n=1 Tax=Hylemonella gracilis TaxID=80880 RepID=UPI0011102792|nr:hypothetical protein [Hylemonella gracilis]
MKKAIFIRDGKLTWIAEIVLISVVVFGWYGVPYLNQISFWLALPLGAVSLIAAFTLMFEGRASAIGFKPFTNDPLGWRKAKRTYREKQPEENESR